MANPFYQQVGGHDAVVVGPFSALEAVVANTTRIPYLSTAAGVGDPMQPYPGVVVGVMVGSVASADFTCEVTVDGTEDAGSVFTVDAAGVYKQYKTNEYIAFAKGEAIGVRVLADTTSKNVAIGLVVSYDVKG